jgi:hypothetical protein
LSRAVWRHTAPLPTIHHQIPRTSLVDPTKIVVIIDLEPPTSVRQLRETLGHTGYYKKFIKGYGDQNTDRKFIKEGSEVSME